MTRTLGYVAVVGAVALSSLGSRAHAYSDPSGFTSNPVDEGGGGGRWFTGSPADGYTCNVCHSGGANPDLSVSGLPIDGYIPGAAYEVIVDWPDSLAHLGMSAELTDENGNAAGEVRLPDNTTVDAREQCAASFGAGILAATMNDVPARKVMNVADCGAQRLRFLWIAPPEPRGQLWLSGALVAADGMGDVHGDGVTDFARPITAGGGEPVASTVGGCSVATGSPITASMPWLLFGLAWFVRSRRARR